MATDSLGYAVAMVDRASGRAQYLTSEILHKSRSDAESERDHEAGAAIYLGVRYVVCEVIPARASVANAEAGRQDLPLSRLVGLTESLNLDLGALIAPGDLPPPPHDVTITRVYEVCCRTCGSVVIDVTDTSAKARQARADHIAATTENRGPKTHHNTPRSRRSAAHYCGPGGHSPARRRVFT